MPLKDRPANDVDRGPREAERVEDRRAAATPEAAPADGERTPAVSQDWRSKLWKTSRTVFWNWD
jgi:hypothetical protein